jgi:uncharacterized protein (UPF0335 family)
MLMDEVEERPANAPPLTAAEKRDARRAAKTLKKLEAEDRATASLSELTKPAEIIKPAATNAQLIAFVERVENVELELAERSEDRKQIYAEARSCGFDVPTMKKIVALRKMDEKDRLEADALLATYMHGVGMAMQTEMNF